MKNINGFWLLLGVLSGALFGGIFTDNYIETKNFSERLNSEKKIEDKKISDIDMIHLINMLKVIRRDATRGIFRLEDEKQISRDLYLHELEWCNAVIDTIPEILNQVESSPKNPADLMNFYKIAKEISNKRIFEYENDPKKIKEEIDKLNKKFEK